VDLNEVENSGAEKQIQETDLAASRAGILLEDEDIEWVAILSSN